MTTTQAALAKLASNHPDPVDSLKSFGIPGRRLFPLDSADLTTASIGAFEHEARKLDVVEKIACARAITAAAEKQKVDNRGLAAKLASSNLGRHFSTFMNMRSESCAWHPEAVREVETFKDLGAKIAKTADIGLRPQILAKLAAQIEVFDRKWDAGGSWYARGLPDPAYSVFGDMLDQHEPLPAPPDYVKVANRAIRAVDLSDDVLKSAERFLGAEKVATVMTAKDRLAAFAAWDHVHQEIVASAMPEVRA